MIGAPVLRIGTRGSPLALAQTSLVVAALRAGGGTASGLPSGSGRGSEGTAAAIETVVIRSRGDLEPATPAGEMEGQGWFTSELERSLLERRVDLAVHSAKDLPTRLAEGLVVAALLPRGDPRDAAVTRDGAPLAELPPGASVGTGSPRRSALLAGLHPRLRPVPLRGNVDGRLRRLRAGEVDALLLAAAGLDRLDLRDVAGERLDPRRFVPAPAQGAIAVEALATSEAAAGARALDDPVTAAAVRAERALLSALGGGCQLPLGAWARLEEGRLVLTAALGAPEGIRRVELAGEVADPARLGAAAAARLRSAPLRGPGGR